MNLQAIPRPLGLFHLIAHLQSLPSSRSTEMRMIFMKLFDCLLDYVQYSTSRLSIENLRHRSESFSLADIEPNHLQACLCYVENAIGSAKSDLSEDSIERFSCFARLKIKYKSLGSSFARLQFYLYRLKTSAIQGRSMEIDEIFYRSKTIFISLPRFD